MAGFTTALAEFSESGSSKTYVASASHTASAPRLVIQKRRLAEGNRKYYEMEMDIVHGLLDSESLPVATKLSSNLVVKVPTQASELEIDALLVHLRDFVASDQFATAVKKQLWFQ